MKLQLFAVFQLPLQAADSTSLQANIYAQRLSAYQLQTLFYLLSIEEGASKVAAQLQVVAQRYGQLRQQLPQLSAGQGLDAEVAALQVQGQRF
ncbi:MAG: hypothetical protein WA173_05040 [Pseudomonas sp.]|uniref:hypothetical protein n=1 Tax=Pseudomonas sp. TaxID=306 RepID=UPI003BB75557